MFCVCVCSRAYRCLCQLTLSQRRYVCTQWWRWLRLQLPARLGRWRYVCHLWVLLFLMILVWLSLPLQCTSKAIIVTIQCVPMQTRIPAHHHHANTAPRVLASRPSPTPASVHRLTLAPSVNFWQVLALTQYLYECKVCAFVITRWEVTQCQCVYWHGYMYNIRHWPLFQQPLSTWRYLQDHKQGCRHLHLHLHQPLRGSHLREA